MVGFDLLSASLPFMDREQEVYWFGLRSTNRRDEADDRIVRSNIRYINFIAASCYSFHAPPLEDLTAEGILAMVGSLDRFDPARGVLFRTYYFRIVKTAIVKSIWTHLLGEKFMSRSKEKVNELLKKIYNLNPLTDEMIKEKGSIPSPCELFDRAGFTKEEVSLYLRAFGDSIDLDAPLYDRSESILWSDLFPKCEEDALGDLIEEDQFNRALIEIDNLSCRKTAYIIRQYYGIDNEEPLSLQILSDMMDVSVSLVSMMKVDGIDEIRRRLYSVESISMDQPTEEPETSSDVPVG